MGSAHHAPGPKKGGWTNLLPVLDNCHQIKPDFRLRVTLYASLNVDCSSLEPLRLGARLEQNRPLLEPIKFVHVAAYPHVRDKVKSVIVYRARGPFLIDNERFGSASRKSHAHTQGDNSALTLLCAGSPPCTCKARTEIARGVPGIAVVGSANALHFVESKSSHLEQNVGPTSAITSKKRGGGNT